MLRSLLLLRSRVSVCRYRVARVCPAPLCPVPVFSDFCLSLRLRVGICVPAGVLAPRATCVSSRVAVRKLVTLFQCCVCPCRQVRTPVRALRVFHCFHLQSTKKYSKFVLSTLNLIDFAAPLVVRAVLPICFASCRPVAVPVPPSRIVYRWLPAPFPPRRWHVLSSLCLFSPSSLSVRSCARIVRQSVA